MERQAVRIRKTSATEREAIFELTKMGYSYMEIAKKLDMNKDTVRYHQFLSNKALLEQAKQISKTGDLFQDFKAQLTDTELIQMLHDRGYRGTLRQVRTINVDRNVEI